MRAMIRAAVASLVVLMLSTLLGGPVAQAAPPPAPTLLAPASGSAVTTPFTISWSQVLDPTALNGGYNWQLSSTADFSQLVAQDATKPGQTQDTVSGVTAGAYFWRVQAVNGFVEVGPWSAGQSVTITAAGPGQPGVPTLNPSKGGTQFHPYEAIQWTWSGVAGAATYTAEWSRDSRFLVDGVTYFTNTNIPTTLTGFAFGNGTEGTWFMRVRALDANRVKGNPSNVISFSVFYNNPVGPPPTIIAPTGNPTLTLPVTLSWTDGYNPQDLGYEVQVSSTASFSTIEQPTAGHTDPRRVLTSLTAGPKFWRVRSHQGDSSPTTAAVTAWSATGSFTISSAPAVPASVTLTRDPLYSGAEERIQLQLTGPAPAGGAAVRLSSSDPSALPVPATASVTAGIAWTELTVFAGQVTTPTPVTVTATFGGSSTSATITVMPPTLKPDPLQSVVRATGGATMAGRLDLQGNGFAPTGGVEISISSDSPVATVPAAVTIPAGANSRQFTIQTSPVTVTTTVTIRATYAGLTAQWQLTLTPPPRPASLTLRPASTTNGSQGLVTITPDSIAGYDQLIPVTSSDPGVATTTTYATIPASQELGRFDIATTRVAAPTTVAFSVSGGGVTVSSNLSVYPALPTLTSLTVNPTSVTGGASTTGTVTLSGGAPAGGVTVSLGANLPGAATVPATVTVPAGATSATFTVTTFPVDSTTVQLSAALDNVFQFAALSITRAAAAPTLSALTLSPSSVAGGASSTGTVTLAAAAPSGGTVVTLSDNSAAATVPTSVTVAAGATSRTFTVTTTAVTSSTPISISGSSGGSTRSATLTVTPPAPAAPALVSPAQSATPAQPLVLDWSDVAGATSYRVQIDDSSTFAAPFVVDGTVTSSQFTAPALGARQHWWRVQAVSAAGTASAWSVVRRFTPQAIAAAPSLSTVALNPSTVVGGSSSTGTVALTTAAPSGGAVVMLSSNAAAATTPASVTIAAGATSATFPITTSSVTSSVPVTITGSYGGVTRTATLTVTAPPAAASLSTVSLTPASVTGGAAAQGTVSLTSAAPAGGLAVALSSSGAAATVPASVTVPAGASGVNFPIGTSAVTTSTTVTITAQAGGLTKSATLTVTPPATTSTATVTVTATGRSGEQITSSPAGITVTVGSTGSASFAAGTAITLSSPNGRDVVWSGACSSGGAKARTCTFSVSGTASVTAAVQ